MENQAQNPYKAPEAEVESAATDKISEVFERFSAWGVFGLSLITFGIYNMYWHYNRSQRINERMEYQISSLFINATLTLWVLSFIANAGGFLPPMVTAILGFASLAYLVMYIMWCFKIRAAIHAHVNAEKGTYAWANAFLTIFGALYLQYKINKIIDNE